MTKQIKSNSVTSAVQLCWCAVGKTAEAKRKKHEQSLICYKRLFTIDFFKKNKTKKNRGGEKMEKLSHFRHKLLKPLHNESWPECVL